MERIPDFLCGKTLFITGGTAFVTKGLVEKLLRSAPGIRKIYLLIRDRTRASGEVLTAPERLEREVLASTVFDRLRRERRDSFQETVCGKLEAVSGDLTRDRIGLDDTVYRRLAAEVDIVISVGASVNFDERLDWALEVNTLGPRRVVALARECRDAVFLHVSTAYVWGQQTGRILEAELPSNRTLAQMLNGSSECFDIEAEIETIRDISRRTTEASDSPEVTTELENQLTYQNRGRRVTEHRWTHQLDALRARWVTRVMVLQGRQRARQMGWHDSYTLTKAMGEQLIVSTRGNLPTAIVRPSIIESGLEEPERGWLDGLKVADPLIAHFGKGRLSNFPGDPNVILDIIPVDIVANTVIAALPQIRQSSGTDIYHVATGSENPLRVGEIFELVYDYFRHHPMLDRNGSPISVRRWRFPSLRAFRRSLQLKYGLPLRLITGLVDQFSFMPWSNRFRRSLSIRKATLERILALSEIYSPYTHLNCTFDTTNTRRLFESLHPADRQLYNFDVTRIEWRNYIQETHIPGLKRFVLKSGDDLPADVPKRPAQVAEQIPSTNS